METGTLLEVAARGRHLPLHCVPESSSFGRLADSCQASGPVRSSEVGTDACPSARVDTFAPTPLVQEDEMCGGVLAKFPEMSTWRDKPLPAPWPLAGPVMWGIALDRTRSQEHATVTKTADRLPGRHHLVRGGGSLFGQVEDPCSHYWP